MARHDPPADSTVMGHSRQITAYDWTNRVHWSWRAHPCRICGLKTHLLDYGSQPCHKVCYEKEQTP